jgi:BlaI family penicillinase repressor
MAGSLPAPSDRELDLLKVMWKLGEAKVRDIHDAICPDGECAFTTVQTLVRIMCRKGLVKKRADGRTDYYTPVYTIENATSRFVDKLFDGAVEKFVVSMLSAESVSVDEMRDMEKMIARARRTKEKQVGEEQ